MRRLILKMSISLDGFVAGPNGEMDWMLRSRDEGGRNWVEETLWQAGLHIMGSRSFFAMAGYWSTANDPLAAPMNEIPKAVFTRQSALDVSAAGSGNWPQAEIINGDLATEIARLKQQPGKYILVQGGVEFAQNLAAAGLIDEYRLVVHPVVLGQGQALFARVPKPLDLQLHASTVFRSGTTALVYRPA
ncbi:dihydrofolate reductase family protein [Dyella sp. 2RAB6]|uniref:dihydrofolate reductase family protein n=1 Tax=Dyella sp. 2RAB6 TaxID=3232992 RepID=UPI003F8E4296